MGHGECRVRHKKVVCRGDDTMARFGVGASVSSEQRGCAWRFMMHWYCAHDSHAQRWFGTAIPRTPLACVLIHKTLRQLHWVLWSCVGETPTAHRHSRRLLRMFSVSQVSLYMYFLHASALLFVSLSVFCAPVPAEASSSFSGSRTAWLSCGAPKHTL
jgi:hypothetical protein